MGKTTLLFTDIEESTLLLEKSPERYVETLRLHHEILRDVALERGGREFQDAGDGLWFAFDVPIEAVRAAIAMQARLAAADWTPEIGMPRVRMALHLADAEFRDGQYRGRAVHQTSRLVAACHGGQVLTMGSLQEAVAGAEDIGLTSLGTYHLRGFKKAEPLFQLDPAGTSKTFPPLKVGHARRHNLPENRDPFFGRAAELAEIEGILRRKNSSVRLVTLTGPGGIGKTRMALAVARRLLGAYDHGVVFVPLVEVTKAEAIPHAVLLALGAKPDSTKNPMEQIDQLLGETPTLLVLDNFEQFLGEGALIVHHLLAKVPALRLLVTSRSSLGLAGERKFHCSTLAVPPTAETNPDILKKFDCVQLFLERVGQVRSEASLDASEIVKVAEVCRLLDGMPLALELAAAQMKVFTAGELVEALRENFAMLASDSLQGQRTLEAIFDWSRRLLPPDIAKFFLTLSLFSGGWTAKTAAEINGISHELALGYIHYLLTCSLIHATEKAGGIRFDMLEPIRQMADARLGADRGKALRRHSEYFRTLVRKIDTEFGTADQEALCDRLDAETSNVLAAIEREPRNEERVFAAIDFHQFALFGKCNRHLRSLLTTFRSDGGEIRPATLARAWHSAGILDLMVNDLDSANTALMRALTLFEELGDADSLMKTRYNLAIVAQRRGLDSEDQRIYQQTLAYFQDRNAAEECATVLQRLSSEASRQGRFEQARSCLQECLELCRRNDNMNTLATALCSYGEVQIALNDHRGAWVSLLESVNLKIRLGHQLGLVNSFYPLGKLACHGGDYQSAAFFLGVIRGLADKYHLRLSGMHTLMLQCLETIYRDELSEMTFLQEEGRGRKAGVTEWLEAIYRIEPPLEVEVSPIHPLEAASVRDRRMALEREVSRAEGFLSDFRIDMETTK
jgi:predicted ATPase/class 3 adenylate cyclase